MNTKRKLTVLIISGTLLTAAAAALALSGSTVAASPETVTIYVSMGADGQSRCTFGEVEACRLFRVEVALQRDAYTHAQTFEVVSFTEVLPDVPAVMPAVSPDGQFLVFMAGSDSGEYQLRHLYLLDLENNTTLDITAGQTHNNMGQWARWQDNRQIVFSNLNDCSGSPRPTGCNFESRYQDAVVITLNPERTAVESAELVFGDVNPQTGLDSTACAAEDPAPFPGDSSIIAFHSTSVDGTSGPRDASCPWIEGMSGLEGGNAVPIVLRLDADAPGDLAASLTPGEDYWPVDLAGAGIDGCAHPDFSPDGKLLICTEQGSQKSYRECSDPSLNGPQCTQEDEYGILFNRVFGYTLQDGQYRSVNQGEALFSHLHPSQLPTADRLWPTDPQCAIYLTKYAEVGPDSTLLATVLCRGEQEVGATAFSRLFLIDFADPQNPVYFDLTGWAEDAYPNRWAPGQAMGFTGTFVLP